jgi:excinuclease UvrABC nuclease subunit
MKRVKWSVYEFGVYEPTTTTWSEKSGIYIFAGINPQSLWVALYIGQALSFSDRLANHDQWNAAARLGATHVHARVVPLQANRDTIERDLIRAYQPPLNIQLK